MKPKSRLGPGKLARKVLRLFREDVKSPVSSIGQKKVAHVAPPAVVCHDYQRETRSALINTERKRAEALQNRRFIW